MNLLKISRVLFAAIVLQISMPLFSQNIKEKEVRNGPFFQMMYQDSLSSFLRSYVNATSSKYFQDPRIPRFLMVDRSDKFVFGIGGYVAALGYYDYRSMPGPSFVLNRIPIQSKMLPGDSFDLNMGLTRLSFKIIGRSKLGMINAYIETDFNNSQYHLRLRHAYIEIWGLRVGQSWSTYMDSEIMNTVDPQGFASLSSCRVPLLSYTALIGNGFKISAALEFTQKVSTTVDENIVEAKQVFPDMPISFSYSNKHFHIYAAYNQRMMKLSELGENAVSRYTSSFQLSGNVKINPEGEVNHIIYAQGIYNYGMNDRIQDLAGQGTSVIISSGKRLMDIPSSIGCYGGYHIKFGKSQFNAGYSYVRLWTDKELACGKIYKNAHYAVLNYMYNIARYGIVGLEAVYGYRKNILNQSGDDFRINLYLRYDF